MLARASSRSDRALESVKLVFLLELKKQAYPETLKKYFQEVIAQSVSVLDSPSDAVANAMPEAVSLAVRISSDERLCEVIRSIVQDSNISSAQAELALSSLEASCETNRESAHFSREVYRAI